MTRALAVALVVFGTAALAHDGLDEQIAAATRRIATQPANATLFLERGELYRLHGEWDRARADFDRAAALDPALVIVDFARGRLELSAGDAVAAKAALDRFLARQPAHAEARLTRARALVRLGRAGDAIADYDAAVAHAAAPAPDLYHERARVAAESGSVDEALRGLDEGLARLGPIVSLQRQAIALELARANYDGALARLETITSRAPRKESYLAEKGEILERAGRAEEAQRAYREALDHIAALPRAQRSSPATVGLAARVEEALRRHQR